jgi:hypothetical protein
MSNLNRYSRQPDRDLNRIPCRLVLFYAILIFKTESDLQRLGRVTDTTGVSFLSRAHFPSLLATTDN